MRAPRAPLKDAVCSFTHSLPLSVYGVCTACLLSVSVSASNDGGAHWGPVGPSFTFQEAQETRLARAMAAGGLV